MNKKSAIDHYKNSYDNNKKLENESNFSIK